MKIVICFKEQKSQINILFHNYHIKHVPMLDILYMKNKASEGTKKQWALGEPYENIKYV